MARKMSHRFDIQTAITGWIQWFLNAVSEFKFAQVTQAKCKRFTFSSSFSQ